MPDTVTVLDFYANVGRAQLMRDARTLRDAAEIMTEPAYLPEDGSPEYLAHISASARLYLKSVELRRRADA